MFLKIKMIYFLKFYMSAFYNHMTIIIKERLYNE